MRDASLYVLRRAQANEITADTFWAAKVTYLSPPAHSLTDDLTDNSTHNLTDNLTKSLRPHGTNLSFLYSLLIFSTFMDGMTK
jgi:hypothetical protein